MARIVYGPQQVVLNFNGPTGNKSVAEIQSIAHKRFSTGQGFFMTMAGETDDGEPSVTGYWLHPSIPIIFQYDAIDESDDYLLPIEVDQELVDRYIGFCDEPLGVIIGFGSDGPWLPFAPPPVAETAAPAVSNE